ncbi:hypothetical protein MBANPS3_012291 [Mucor bainieri]
MLILQLLLKVNQRLLARRSPRDRNSIEETKPFAQEEEQNKVHYSLFKFKATICNKLQCIAPNNDITTFVSN